MGVCSIVVFVGAADAFLLGARVILGEDVHPHGGNGLIIVLGQTQQIKITAKDIDLGNVITPFGRPADRPPKSSSLLCSRINRFLVSPAE